MVPSGGKLRAGNVRAPAEPPIHGQFHGINNYGLVEDMYTMKNEIYIQKCVDIQTELGDFN